MGYIAVLTGIGDQVRGHLREAPRIPRAFEAPLLPHLDHTTRSRCLRLTHDARDDLREIERFAHELNATGQAAAGEVEQVLDHAAHAIAARYDALGSGANLFFARS